MSDQPSNDPVELTEEMKTDKEAADYAKRAQYARSEGGAIDPGLGNMGGAGASGSTGPDLAHNSTAMPGNSSDLPKP